MGIGLVLAKRTIESFGGSIRAESPPGGIGSSFIIELPAATDGVPSLVDDTTLDLAGCNLITQALGQSRGSHFHGGKDPLHFAPDPALPHPSLRAHAAGRSGQA